MSSQLEFPLDTFRRHDLPNLLINIWSYSHCTIEGCSICEQYKNFCIFAAKEKWCGFYHNFNEVVKAIETDTWIRKIQKVSTGDKDIIYIMITLKSYGGFCHDVITKL